MQDNFNINEWRLQQAINELNKKKLCTECGAGYMEEGQCNECGYMEEATFTSKHDDNPELKGGQKDLPDELQAQILSKEATMSVEFNDDDWSESVALKIVNSLRQAGFDNDKIRLVAKAMMNMPSLREEINEDHEVSIAQNSLKSIVSSASKLMAMLGNSERDIPGWIQDHITNAENYIDQAAQGFHELEDKINEETLNENNLTIEDWNEYVNPDYVLLKLSNGKSLKIEKKRIKGGSQMYQNILHILDSMNSNPKAKQAMEKLVNQMAKSLEN